MHKKIVYLGFKIPPLKSDSLSTLGIAEWFGVEVDPKDHLAPTPAIGWTPFTRPGSSE